MKERKQEKEKERKKERREKERKIPANCRVDQLLVFYNLQISFNFYINSTFLRAKKVSSDGKITIQ